MLEWEDPPTFSSSQSSGVNVLMSAAKLKMVSTDIDFLQGRADGPHTVFAGTYCQSTPSASQTVWEGWIRHKKDTFRYAAFVSGSSSASIQIEDDTPAWTTITTCDYGEGTAGWTEIGGSTDISGLSITSGSWYRLRVGLDGTGGSMHLAMLEETCPVQGWTAVPTFAASTDDLAASLNTLRDDLNALKTQSDRPFAGFGGMTTNIEDSTASDLWYEDDSYVTGHYGNCYFGGGFFYPAWSSGSAYIHYVFEVDAGSAAASIYAMAGGNAWGDAVSEFSASAADKYYGTVNVTDIADTAGCLCRMRIKVEADPSACGAERFEVLYLSVYADETATLSSSRLKYWESGCHLDFADLNMAASRLDLLNGSAKLSTWRNAAVKRVGITSPESKEGFRVGLHRRRGFPYLHYRSNSGQERPMLRYPNPDEDEWYTLYLDTASDEWHWLDLNQIRGLHDGMYYNADEVEVAQEWDEQP